MALWVVNLCSQCAIGYFDFSLSFAPLLSCRDTHAHPRSSLHLHTHLFSWFRDKIRFFQCHTRTEYMIVSAVTFILHDVNMFTVAL